MNKDLPEQIEVVIAGLESLKTCVEYTHKDMDNVEARMVTLKKAIDGMEKKAGIEPDLTTPPGIKFMVNSYEEVIGLCFNDDKQVLWYSQTDIFCVTPASAYVGDPVECLPLTPCKYEDLKPGEFLSVSEIPDISSIRLKLPPKDSQLRQARISMNGGVQNVYSIGCDVWKIG